jgi:hypothetical protein
MQEGVDVKKTVENQRLILPETARGFSGKVSA